MEDQNKSDALPEGAPPAPTTAPGKGQGLSTDLQPGGTIPGGSPASGVGSIGTGQGSSPATGSKPK